MRYWVASPQRSSLTSFCLSRGERLGEWAKELFFFLGSCAPAVGIYVRNQLKLILHHHHLHTTVYGTAHTHTPNLPERTNLPFARIFMSSGGRRPQHIGTDRSSRPDSFQLLPSSSSPVPPNSARIAFAPTLSHTLPPPFQPGFLQLPATPTQPSLTERNFGRDGIEMRSASQKPKGLHTHKHPGSCTLSRSCGW